MVRKAVAALFALSLLLTGCADGDDDDVDVDTPGVTVEED